MSVLPIGISGEAGAYQIERSVRFNSSDSSYFSRTPASAGNRKTWTYSVWAKRSGLATAQNILRSPMSGSTTGIRFSGSDGGDSINDGIRIFFENASAGDLQTTQVFRDVSAWYHIVISVDTTQSTASNRVKLYVNGSQITVFSTSTYPSQNYDTQINNNAAHAIGTYGGSSEFLSGYLTEVNFIDGQALDPTSFGEFNTDTGVWQPKAYTGSYGTNGFYLDFADNSSTTALGYDAAGSNDWTPNNFSVTAGAGNDSLVDTPTRYGTDTGAGGEVRGNYATWNPLDKDSGISSVTEGNLKVVTNGSDGSIKSTIAFPSGKWYWEVTSDSVSGSGTQAIGIMPQSQPPTNNMSDSGKLGYAIDASFSDRKFENGTATSYGSYTQGNGVVYMLAFDQDAGKLWYGVNGTWLASGAPATGSNPSSSSISTSTAYCAAVSDNTVSGTFTVNFGQRPFAYTAPSGFKALCTTNLPEPTIADGGEYFNAVLYTGNGGTNSITTDFTPGLVWQKNRSSAANNILVNQVVGGSNYLISNSTNAEAPAPGYMTFGTTTSFSSTDIATNQSGQSYVAWNWKANGAGVSNTAGTINSTVSANTTSGFSIVTYTGNASSNQSVGHGLGVKPAFIIVKKRSTTGGWVCWHQGLTGGSEEDRYIYLNSTDASGVTTDYWGTSGITSSTFGVWATGGDNNASGATFVSYAFAPVAGYSAFGSYTGNGSSDGPFVFTGHRSRFVLIKRTDTSGYSWYIWDTERNTYNEGFSELYPNLSNAESGGTRGDILSNGFKLRTTGAAFNASGGTYIYAAFAENPVKYSLSR